jgi:hypothetical protein
MKPPTQGEKAIQMGYYEPLRRGFAHFPLSGPWIPVTNFRGLAESNPWT